MEIRTYWYASRWYAYSLFNTNGQGRKYYTPVTKSITIDTVAPTASHTYYRNGVEITDPIAYVQGVDEVTFTGEYSDTVPSSGLYWDSFVIFEAQDDGSFRFSADGKLSFCGWRTQPNLVILDSYIPGTHIDFTDCIDTLPNGNYYMAHHIYDNATRKDIPSINQFRDVLGLNFIVDNTLPVLSQVDNFELIQGTDIEPVIIEITENVGLEKVCVNLPDYNLEFCDDTISPDITEYDFMQFVFDELGITVVDTNVVPIGEYNIEYYAHDLAGNKSAITSLVINVVKNQPTVQIESDDKLTDILLGTPVTLSATVTGGTAPFTYQWGGDCIGTEETTEFTSTAAGNYTCTVLITDLYGNTSQDEIDIVVSPAPTPTPTPTVIPDTGDVAGAQDQTTITTTTSPQPTTQATGTGGPLFAYTTTTTEDETEEEVDDTEIEEETVTLDNPEVKGEEDNEEQNSEEETTEEEQTKWWVYPLVILPVLAIFLILWKRRKEDNEPQF